MDDVEAFGALLCGLGMSAGAVGTMRADPDFVLLSVAAICAGAAAVLYGRFG